nr:MAG TPA: minor capsid protein [Caudoviricetes sp.]
MRVNKDRLTRYRKELDSAADDAAEFMSDYYDALRTANPNSSVAELRNMAIKSIKQALNAFSPQAGEIAGELFDEIVKAEGVKARFRYHQTIEQGLVDKKVRYLAKDLVDGNNQKFIDACATLTRFYVHREANTNMYRNVARSNIRWARVPSGTETCGWCFMLSTRGFDYTSELKAGGLGHKFHLHCDCIIVPGTEDTTIDGYKPEEMYARWVECANTLGLEPTWENRFAIIAECERRDFKWLYNGDKPKVTWRKTKAEFRKNSNGEQEIALIELLQSKGFNVTARKEDAPEGEKNIDLLIGNILYEMKIPKSSNVRSVESNLRHAKGQFKDAHVNDGEVLDGTRVVFWSRDMGLSDEKISEEIERQIKAHDIAEVIFVDKDNNLHRY